MLFGIVFREYIYTQEEGVFLINELNSTKDESGKTADMQAEHQAVREDNAAELSDCAAEGGMEHLEKLEIAKIMLKKEIDIQTIEEITGLTKDEIEKLK